MQAQAIAERDPEANVPGETGSVQVDPQPSVSTAGTIGETWDEAVAEAVGQAIQRYPHYSVFDYLDGGIDTGVVTLWGKVTADREKADEIFERVAKIQGVQDVRSDIQTMPPSTADVNLRRSIFQAVSRSTHFERVSQARNPPFHIIVHNSVVTLVGYVQGEIEQRELVRIVTQTQGVLRVENQLLRVR